MKLKRWMLTAALAMTLPSVALAQPAKAAPDKPAAKEQKAEKEQTSAKEQKEPAAARKPKRTADARHCLGQATNTAIIKCAEAYL